MKRHGWSVRSGGLLKQAEALDRSEDVEHGSDGDDGGLPQELKRRADRLKVIQAAKERLEERQRQEDKADARTIDEQGQTRRMTGRRRLRAFGDPPRVRKRTSRIQIRAS